MPVGPFIRSVHARRPSPTRAIRARDGRGTRDAVPATLFVGRHLRGALVLQPRQLRQSELVLKGSTRPRLQGAPGRFDHSLSSALHGVEPSAAVPSVIWNLCGIFHP